MVLLDDGRGQIAWITPHTVGLPMGWTVGIGRKCISIGFVGVWAIGYECMSLSLG